MALLSRVAESLFWLGRYVERAENTARLLDVAYHGRFEPTDQGVAGALNTWEALIATLGMHEEYFDGTRTASEADVVQYLTVSTENGSSIVSSLSQAREAARSVRDFLSSEMRRSETALRDGGGPSRMPAAFLCGAAKAPEGGCP